MEEARALLTRLDGLAWGKIHTRITIALGIGWLLDSLEVNIVGNVLGILKQIWHLTDVQSSYIVSLWLFGIMIGALGFGLLSDLFGRKRLFLITIAVYASFTLLTALAWDFTSLSVLRFITALGVGAEYSAINAAVAELIPARYRGTANGVVMNFWPLGAILGALVTVLFIGLLPPEIGWRFGFAAGALAAVAMGWLRRAIPESPRWLIAHGRVAEARQIVAALASASSVTPAPAPAPAATLPRRLPGYVWRLVIGWVMAISLGAGYYGLFAAVPLVLLPALHLSGKAVPWFFIVGNVAALAGGLLMSWLLDAWGRTRTMATYYAATVATTLLLASTVISGNATAATLAFMLNMFFNTGAWTSAYVFTTELFPTQLRATGLGLAVAVGRLAAAFAPVLVITVFHQAGLRTGFLTLAGFWAIGLTGILIWSWVAPDQRHARLEERFDPRHLLRAPAEAVSD